MTDTPPLPSDTASDTPGTPWLTVAQVARITQYHPKYIERLCREQRIKAIHPGPWTRYLVHPDDLDAWMHGKPTSSYKRRGPRLAKRHAA